MIATHEAICLEMQAAVRDIAGSRHADDSIKALIGRAAIRAAMPFNRIRKYWYGELSVIPAHEADHIRAVRRKSLRAKVEAQKTELEQLQRELDEWP